MNLTSEIESLWKQFSESDSHTQCEKLVELFHLLNQAGSDDCIAVGMRAVEGFMQKDDWEEALDFAQYVASTLGERGRRKEARDLLVPLIPFGTLVDSRTAGLLRWNYANTLSELGETADALFEFEQACETFPVDSFFARAALTQCQSQMLRQLSQIDAAKSRLLEAIDLFRMAENMIGVGRCELELAELQLHEDPKTAYTHAFQAVSLFDFARKSDDLLRAKLICGRCCLIVGEFDEAQALLSEVSEARGSQDNNKIAAEATFHLAERIELLGDYNLSTIQFRSLVPVLKALNLDVLAELALSKGKKDD